MAGPVLRRDPTIAFDRVQPLVERDHGRRADFQRGGRQVRVGNVELGPFLVQEKRALDRAGLASEEERLVRRPTEPARRTAAVAMPSSINASRSPAFSGTRAAASAAIPAKSSRLRRGRTSTSSSEPRGTNSMSSPGRIPSASHRFRDGDMALAGKAGTLTISEVRVRTHDREIPSAAKNAQEQKMTSPSGSADGRGRQ